MVRNMVIEDDDTDLPDKTGIDWLDVALIIANQLIAQLILETLEDWQSGNAIVLKTIEP